MMNISNLIIAGITFIIFVCAAIYLYNKNSNVSNANQIVNNTNGTIEKFQVTSPQNPITIADMATSVMDNSVNTEYSIFKMIGSLTDISGSKEYPLYSTNTYKGTNYPSKNENSTSISIDNSIGRITLSPTKKYKIHFTFTKQHVKIIGTQPTTSTYTDIDAIIYSYDNFNNILPSQTYSNTAQILKNASTSLANSLVTLNIYAIISNVSYIIPVIRYRNNATLATSGITDTSSYMFIEQL